MTAVSIAMRPGSRRHLFWVILVLSLALNLCFIAGALWIRVQGPPLPTSPEQRLQQIEPQLVFKSLAFASSPLPDILIGNLL